MHIFLRSTFFLLFGLLASASAGDFTNWSTNTDQGVFSFVETFSGPRTTALSGTGASELNADVFAVFSNPASVLNSPDQHTVAFAFETGALDRQLGLLAWRFNWGKAAIQTTYAWISNDPIPGMDENGNPTTAIYNPFDQDINLSASFPFADFTAGITAKYIIDHLSNDVGDQNAMGIAMDWGLVWRSPSPRYGAALAVLNVGRQLTAYTTGGEDSLALNTTIRLSTHYRPVAIRSLTVFLDGDFPRYSEPLARLGLEYFVTPWLQLRAGTVRSMSGLVSNFASADQMSIGTGGIGIVLGDFTFDYSINILRDGLGQLHRFDLRTGF